jgi:hypothetical protein
MAGIMDTLLKGLASTDSVKDYQHASRIFVNSNMLRSPKYAFMFYVIFDYNDSEAGLATPMSRGAQIGALCKSAQLPKYTIEAQSNNAYNRTVVSQKRLKYDPVSLKFHDDSDDIIREFWYDYMSFYYRDSDYQTPIYSQDHKYVDRQKDAWGYGLRTQQTQEIDLIGSSDYHPLKAIRIYSFYRKRFSEYTLINPIITAFRHGEHSNEGSNLMEHEMTVQYEAVKYAVGYVSPDNFGDSMLLLYDMTPSSLSRGGSIRSVFGTGGLIQTINNTVNDLANGNYAAAFLKINRTQQTFAGSSIRQVLRDEGLDMVNRAVRTGTNPLSTVNAPTVASSSGLALGLLSIAAGGVPTVSTNRTGQQNNIGPQITLARSTPATIDQASPSIDYRAISNGQLVAQVYNPAQQRPQFPQLSTSTTAIRAGTRSPDSITPVTPREVAAQNINLNKSGVVVSGAKQGTPAVQTPPKPTVLGVTNPAVLGLAFSATLEQYAIAEAEQRPDRMEYLRAQIQSLVSSPEVVRLLANDAVNREALDTFIQDLYNPGYGLTKYNNDAVAWAAAKNVLFTKIESIATPESLKFTNDLMEALGAANAAVTDQEKTQAFIKLKELLRNSLLISATQNIFDVFAYANALASNLASDGNPTWPDSKDFEIQR